MTVEQDIQVCIPDDRRHAFLVLSGRLSAELVTGELVTAVARRAGVAFDKAVMERVDAAVRAYAEQPRAMRVAIAEATPPTAPVDAGLAWTPGFDPDQPEVIDAGAGVDHYAGKRMVAVRPGDVVATLRRMAEGADGRDVTGRVIKPRAPRAGTIKLGRGLVADAEGRVIADLPGVLELANATAKVSEQLHVPGDVDFASGNIDFIGAVTIAGGVKPCFSVKTTGDVQVGGLVEDATMNCGGSLDCRRGMTAKSRGEVNVGANVAAVFLNCIHGVVGGRLSVHREIMNCHLEIRGDLSSPRSVLLGGKTTVLGSVELNEIGSENWKETELVLGWSVRAAIDKRLSEIAAEMQNKKVLYDQITALGKRATASQRESVTELEFQLWELDQELVKRKAELERHLKLVEQPMEHASRSVVVHKWIHPKTRIQLGSDTIVFSAAVRGPVRICLDAHDRLMGALPGEPPRWLAELAKGVGARRAA